MAQRVRETVGDASLEKWEYMCSGGFGLVYKATHKDLGKEVVVKLLDGDDGSGALYADLCREADYMEAADQQYVPRVYGMYRGCPPNMGYKGRQGIVMELMEGGSLQSFLITKTKSKPPPWPLAFRLALQVALAMDFLHCKNNLVHMDLKPANILLDADLNAKIADFGLSTVTNSVRSTNHTNKGGTLSYTPPEAFEDTYHRVRSYDVYSYGVLLWTILTGQSPYPGVGQTVLMFRIPRGDRPDLRKIDVQEAAGLAELVELMQRCWDPQPDKRPSFAECVEVTRGVFSRHEEGISAACDLLKPPPRPVGQFFVLVQQTEAATRCGLQGAYWLQVGEEGLTLREAEKKSSVLTWPYTWLRRFGRSKTIVSFEAGRRCDSGPGTFTFKTSQNDDILSLIDLAIARLRVPEATAAATLGAGQEAKKTTMPTSRCPRSPLPSIPDAAASMAAILDNKLRVDVGAADSTDYGAHLHGARAAAQDGNEDRAA